MNFLGYEFYNDLYLFPTYLYGLLGYFLLLFASIFFHELGHLLYFRKIGKKMKLQFVFGTIWDMGFQTGVEKDYNDLSDDDYLYSLWSGVILGLIPIIASSIFWFPSFLMVIPYGVGCISDLKEINKVYSSRGEEPFGLEEDDE